MLHISLGVSLNSSNVIAPNRPLVNRFTCRSLGLRYIVMRRCRQQEPAKPAIRIKRFSNSTFNVQKNICIFGNYRLRMLDLRVLSPLISLSSMTIFCYLPQNSPHATFCHFVHIFLCSYLIVLETS